jgi:hypothetical protein
MRVLIYKLWPLSIRINYWPHFCLTPQAIPGIQMPAFRYLILNRLLEYKMFEENLALLRTHHKNVQRYRQLLESSLTDFEREYIGKRLLEEQSAIDTLSANASSEATSPGPRAAQPGCITIDLPLPISSS